MPSYCSPVLERGMSPTCESLISVELNYTLTTILGLCGKASRRRPARCCFCPLMFFDSEMSYRCQDK